MSYLALILVAIYPPLDIYLRNAEYVLAAEFLECAGYSLLLAALVILLAYLQARQSRVRAPHLPSSIRISVLTSCLALLWIYNYVGLWVRGVTTVLKLDFALLNLFTFALWALLVLVVYRRMVALKTESIKPVVGAINIAAIALVTMSIARGIAHLSQAEVGKHIYNESELSNAGISRTSLPDIYFIVLDGYAREDVLSNLYHHDNSEFLDFLRSQGFFVAEKSCSNYTQTVLSLTATLNLDYLDSEKLHFELTSDFRGDLIGHLKDSRLRKFLSELGYRTVSLESGTNATSIREFDHYLSEYNSNVLAEILLSNINYPFIQDRVSRYFYARHAERVQFALAELPKLRQLGNPLFVLAHVVSPHPPFVFKADGSRGYPDKPYSIADGVSVIKNPNYQRDYAEQLIYLNSLVKNAIHPILSDKQRPAIIIIQGDHGPGSLLDWNNMSSESYRERFGILNAVYFPDQTYQQLDQYISPINTFRTMLNQYFGQHLERLEDKSIYSTWDKPFAFEDASRSCRAN